MSRDDLLMEKDDINQLLKMELLVEEKIDGANLGFSLDSNNNIIAQNRSHYVNSQYHPQFKKLDEWINTNRSDLFFLLKNWNTNNHKYIVYGEWLYSKHSILYDKLPSYFIMFDLYDNTEKKFIQRDIIEKIISENNLSINLVPIIYKGKANLEKLKSLVQTQSNFYDGPVEGVYIRAFNNGEVKYRCKIVRSDFICGNVHWTKEQITKNGLACL
jgi:atypical dual specificity phosphatase